MLAEFFDKLKAAARDAQIPVVLKDDRLPPDRLYYSLGGSDVREIPLPPPVLSLVAHDIESLVDLLAYHGREGEIIAYVASDGVTCTIGHDRRERIRMPFMLSDRWKLINSIGQGSNYLKPADAIKLIRFQLQGCGADSLVAKLSKLTVRTSTVATNVSKHGQDSLGVDVDRKVDQADRIPDTFKLRLSPFANDELCDIEVDVHCGVHIDTENGSVQIRPLADELQRASAEALADVRARLNHRLASHGKSLGALVVLGSIA